MNNPQDIKEMAFYCKDCHEIVDTTRCGRKFVYKCKKCGTKNVAFGTEKSIRGFFRVEDEKEEVKAKVEEKKEEVKTKVEEKKEEVEVKVEEKKEEVEVKVEEKKEEVEVKVEEKKEEVEVKVEEAEKK
jgi:hypothetical protein